MNNTTAKTLTIRFAGFNLSVSSALQYICTFTQNGKLSTKVVNPVFVSGTTYKIYEFALDFETLWDISVYNSQTISTARTPSLSLYVGIGTGSAFAPISFIGNVSHPLRASSFNSDKNVITYDSKEFALGQVESNGGSGLIKTWDCVHYAQVNVANITFKINSGGVATGVKAVLSAYESATNNYVIGLLTFDLPASGNICGLFSFGVPSLISHADMITSFMGRWNKSLSEYLKLEIVGASAGTSFVNAYAYINSLAV